MTREQAIQQTLDEFDFAGVHAFMTLTGWVWAHMEGPDRVPTVEHLKEVARELLAQLNGQTEEIQSGGFAAKLTEESDFSQSYDLWFVAYESASDMFIPAPKVQS